MNTAARTLNESTLAHFQWSDLLSWHQLVAGMLILLLFLSASGIVYIKDLNRRLFYDVQMLQQKHDELSMNHSKLLIEQNTWATQARVQQLAQIHLQMDIPKTQMIVRE